MITTLKNVPGELVVFEGVPEDGIDYVWDFGGGAIPNRASGQHPEVYATQPGTYKGFVLIDRVKHDFVIVTEEQNG